MTQKKNIVILKTDDSLQNEITTGLAEDFSKRFPEYEIVVISEEQYRGVFSFFKRNFKRFFQRVFPAFFRVFRKLRHRHYEKKVSKASRVYAHFQDAGKIKEGAKTGLKVIKNIAYRFKPKCIAVLDAGILAKAVAAKRKYDLNVKLVSVMIDSYFDCRNMFFGVDQYAVLSPSMKERIVAYGFREAAVDTVRIFPGGTDSVVKSAKRAECGLENEATFLVVPSFETRKRFKDMIAEIARGGGEFNILVYCGESDKLTDYFEKVKVELDLYRMKLVEEFDRFSEASDYVLTTPNVRAIHRSFAAQAVTLVYYNRRLLERENADFYVEAGLALPIEDHRDFPLILKKLMTSISYGSVIKEKAGEYLSDLPARAAADTVYDAARRLDSEQAVDTSRSRAKSIPYGLK